MAIELAPNHKTGMTLANPVMPAAGCFGFGTEFADLLDITGLGAIVVGPFTARPRRGAEPPRAVPLADGVLVHTALANRAGHVAGAAMGRIRAEGDTFGATLSQVSRTGRDNGCAVYPAGDACPARQRVVRARGLPASVCLGSAGCVKMYLHIKDRQLYYRQIPYHSPYIASIYKKPCIKAVFSVS